MTIRYEEGAGHDTYPVSCLRRLSPQTEGGTKLRKILLAVVMAAMMSLMAAPAAMAQTPVGAGQGACTVTEYEVGGSEQVFDAPGNPDFAIADACAGQMQQAARKAARR